MNGHITYNDTKRSSQGMVDIDVSFLTNGTSDPAVADMRGGPATDGSGGTTVQSITRTGVGAFLVTLIASCRYVTRAFAQIDDAADQHMARCGAISNEGTGAGGTPITVVVQVRDEAGTAAETTGRRIGVSLACKVSGNGT